MEKNILAIIPARGGSKGIPRKNIYPISGKPLIQYTVEAALASKKLTRIMLNSDDNEIIKKVETMGVDVSYQRPANLATDTARLVHAVLDMLDWLEKRNQLPDVVVLLQPTSPLRGLTLIDDAIDAYLESGLESLVGVNLMKDHPAKSIHELKSGWHYLASTRKLKYVPRRQELEGDYYVINGSIYIATPQWIRQNENFVVEGKTALFKTSEIEGIDVDTVMDAFLVEAYQNALKMIKQK
ncbi:cytidylyltransferase domain-containing protein [Thiomicrorhabdus aquaedulcis]|uniref:acylneuraminate cytidylyltransferase family protein n=1 Tax=Thiomicrorhabdus aquaedulcis TaxID=2211106 RepID=UPI000FD9D084|nr:acylneuraminate cytidylyltransferase family protein [Thiomicrorhabdus aquaedulcis]